MWLIFFFSINIIESSRNICKLNLVKNPCIPTTNAGSTSKLYDFCSRKNIFTDKNNFNLMEEYLAE